MKKITLLAFFLVFIQGCSTLTPLDVIKAANPLAEDKGIEVTAQVGQNNQSEKTKALVKSDVKVETKKKTQVNQDIKADKVEQIVNETERWWVIVLLVLLAGVAIPSPFERRLIKKLEAENHEYRTELINRGKAS